MAVKRSHSAARMLMVFEAVARAQPIGVSALARELGADKSAVQRDLMTLADAGWIAPAPIGSGQWELTPHVLTLARPPHSSHALRQRARPVMERLREQSGETVYLTVPHGGRFVVLDALESPHMLRMVPPVGMLVPNQGSATAQIFRAHLPDGADPALLARGYAVNDGDVVPGSVTLAAALLDTAGLPVGAVVVTGPSDRITPDRRDVIGRQVREAAALLSQG